MIMHTSRLGAVRETNISINIVIKSNITVQVSLKSDMRKLDIPIRMLLENRETHNVIITYY